MRLQRGAARAVLIPYVMSRLIVVATLVVTRHVLTTLHVGPDLRRQATLLGWDAGWYRDIAHSGYSSVAREGLRFFPLFPLLGRAFTYLPGVDAPKAIVFVANLFALLLGFAVYALTRHERPDDEGVARRAVWLVYLLPSAYVLVMGYSEALFMTAATVALLTTRTRQWWIAAAAGLVAGLTRPVGVLLVVPAVIEALRTRDKTAAAAIVAPAAGALAYLAWAEHLTHQFFYPLRVQEDPTRRGGFVDPFRAVGHATRQLFHGDHVSAGVHVVTAVLLAALLIVLYRRWPLSFAVYATVALVVSLCSENLDSLERYGLATVPFVLAIADLTDNAERERIALVLTSAALVAASVLAFTGVIVP
jgi:hypothetical protein